jgi:hypothetical protein
MIEFLFQQYVNCNKQNMLRKILNFGVVLPHTVCDMYKITQLF